MPARKVYFEGAMKRVVRLVYHVCTLPFNLRCHCGGFFMPAFCLDWWKLLESVVMEFDE